MHPSILPNWTPISSRRLYGGREAKVYKPYQRRRRRLLSPARGWSSRTAWSGSLLLRLCTPPCLRLVTRRSTHPYSWIFSSTALYFFYLSHRSCDEQRSTPGMGFYLPPDRFVWDGNGDSFKEGGRGVGSTRGVESHKLDLWPPGCGILILHTTSLFLIGSSLSTHLTCQSNPSLLTWTPNGLLLSPLLSPPCFSSVCMATKIAKRYLSFKIHDIS
jgi:hypothetical protein